MTYVPDIASVKKLSDECRATAEEHLVAAKRFYWLDQCVGGLGGTAALVFSTALGLHVLVQSGRIPSLGRFISTPVAAPGLLASFVAWKVAFYADFRGLYRQHNAAGVAYNILHRRADELKQYMETNQSKSDIDLIKKEWASLREARDRTDNTHSVPIPKWSLKHK